MREVPAVTPRVVPAPRDVPFPGAQWPTGSVDPAVREAADAAFADPELAVTNAVVLIHGGRLVYERYAGAKVHFDAPEEPITAETPLISWSMAKSMLHFIVGTLVDDGRLDPQGPTGLPAWSAAGDPRGSITVHDLLTMRDGLEWCEDYVDDTVSDVIEMLFGAGQDDVAAYAAAKPLRHPPGEVFYYSSGTSNLLSAVVAARTGRGAPYLSYLQERLFGPLAMASATATVDPAGTWIASSFVHATARDFARFGLCYLRGGAWTQGQMIPRAWAENAQVPLSFNEDNDSFYSQQWWVTGDSLGTYWASGYDGQQINISPGADAVLVRLGRTPAERNPALRRWRDRVLAALA